MRTASLLMQGDTQAVQLPKDMQFKGVTEVEISRENDSILLRPKRKSWTSLAAVPMAEADFLAERPDLLAAGRVKF